MIQKIVQGLEKGGYSYTNYKLIFKGKIIILKNLFFVPSRFTENTISRYS